MIPQTRFGHFLWLHVLLSVIVYDGFTFQFGGRTWWLLRCAWGQVPLLLAEMLYSLGGYVWPAWRDEVVYSVFTCAMLIFFFMTSVNKNLQYVSKGLRSVVFFRFLSENCPLVCFICVQEMTNDELLIVHRMMLPSPNHVLGMLDFPACSPISRVLLNTSSPSDFSFMNSLCSLDS